MSCSALGPCAGHVLEVVRVSMLIMIEGGGLFRAKRIAFCFSFSGSLRRCAYSFHMGQIIGRIDIAGTIASMRYPFYMGQHRGALHVMVLSSHPSISCLSIAFN